MDQRLVAGVFVVPKIFCFGPKGVNSGRWYVVGQYSGIVKGFPPFKEYANTAH